MDYFTEMEKHLPHYMFLSCMGCKWEARFTQDNPYDREQAWKQFLSAHKFYTFAIKEEEGRCIR